MGMEEDLGRLAQDDQAKASVNTTADLLAAFRQKLLDSGIPPEETQVYVVTWLTGFFHMGGRGRAE